MNEVLNVIKTRRSCTNYKPDPISREIMDQIIDAGLYSPSMMDEQPWHISVIQDKAALDEIDKLTKYHLSPPDPKEVERIRSETYSAMCFAPALIILSYNKKGSPMNHMGCAMAAQNMHLAAASLGLSARCSYAFINDFFMLEEQKKYRDKYIPDGYEPCIAFYMGYPSEPLPSASQRRSGAVSYF